MFSDFLPAIARACSASPNPSLVVYVAIGAAQGFYPEGAHSAQQYPPFLTNWQPVTAERHVLLIDPGLEDPPRSQRDLVLTTDDTTLRRITFYPARTYFHWTDPDHRAFLEELIRTVLASPSAYLILQDYTGHSVTSEYGALLDTTFRKDATAFLNRILFDPSYDGPGCFQDLTIPVLRDPGTGAFLQPAYNPLIRLATVSPPAVLRKQQEIRSALIRYYAGRLFRGDLSHERSIDALEKLQLFAPIVGYIPTADPTVLRHLIADTLNDFGAVASPPRTYTDADVSALLADTRGTLLNMEFHALTH